VLCYFFFYNLHNLYSFLQSVATTKALEEVRGERAFVLSRSTFSGSGHYVAHWTGDNNADFDDLFYSIPSMLAFNMFGIPMVGADIPGFTGTATKELCTRWIELGSFYPFCRDHNALYFSPKELYEFGPELINISRTILLQRYSLLPYYYTLFWKAHTEGGTVVRPLFFEFPNDPKALTESQFLVGNGLLVTPVTTSSTFYVTGYFPGQSRWYHFQTGEEIQSNLVNLSAPIDTIPTHIRGGLILPTQFPAMVLSDARKNPFQFIIGIGKKGEAYGELYLDNGVEINVAQTKHYNFIKYQMNQSSTYYRISNQIINQGYIDAKVNQLDSIKIFGILSGNKISQVNLNNLKRLSFSFDEKLRVLLIKDIQISIMDTFFIQVDLIKNDL